MALKDVNSEEITNFLHSRPLYTIRQIHGQRIYGPPIDGSMSIPAMGSEIFVDHIPIDASEEELVPFFEQMGSPIYQMRLKINFTGNGRGFAYIKYCDPFVAQTAVKYFNRLELRPGVRLLVELSFDNKQLVIKNIEEIDTLSVIECISPGLVTYLYIRGKKILLLKYESHISASMARRLFFGGKFKQNYHLEWRQPREQQEMITSIWIRNLVITDLHVFGLFLTFNKFVVKKIQLINGLIRVEYCTRSDAIQAFEKIWELSRGNGFELCWAQE